MNISVIIPVYRSEQILQDLCKRLIPILENNTEEFEVIFIEDCGGDNSWNVIEKLSESDLRIYGIKLNKNFGQHNALLCGLREARYDIIVTMDDDLQHPPEEIPKMLERLSDDCDVVYGTPRREQHGWFRDSASIMSKLVLQSLMGAKTARNVSAFRVFRRHLRESFETYHSPVVSIDALLTWSTDSISSVPVEHKERAVGQSGYNFFKLLNHAFSLMTSFTVVPLRFASVVGLLFLTFGIGILVWVVANYFISADQRVPGFAFLASIVVLFSGVQLFSLGILGEYLARIHYRTMDQPSYVVRKTTREEDVQNIKIATCASDETTKDTI